MEMFDVVDEHGNPTGEVVSRKLAHEKGIRHRASHIWVVNRDEKGVRVLLQKRSLEKDSFPGKLDTSSAGHIQAGDEPLESALRELGEELGIFPKPEELTFIGTFSFSFEKVFHSKPFCDNEVAFVYVYNKKVDIDSLTLQKEEVESVCWRDIKEVYKARLEHNDEYCVPAQSLKMLMDYLDIK